jgi:hypothetical protein
VARWHDDQMTQSSRQRLDEIEQDLLSAEPLADCLRKCISLGLALGSDDLRNWATRELEGYPDFDEVPEYRRVPVTIIGDASGRAQEIRNVPVPTPKLPETFQAMIRTGGYPMPDGVADISSYAEQAKRRDGFLTLSIPKSEQLAEHLTPTVLRSGLQFTNIWYRIELSGLDGLLGRVRTQAIYILHEIRELTPDTNEPSAKATNQAVNVVVNGGKHHKINVTTNQAQHGNASSTIAAGSSDDDLGRQGLKWTKRQTYWTIASVILAVIIAAVTLLTS